MPCKCGKRPFQILANASKAAGRVGIALIKGKTVFTTEELANERLKICANGICPWYREKPVMRCAHPDCGCFLKAKVMLLTETCPDSRWREQPIQNNPT